MYFRQMIVIVKGPEDDPSSDIACGCGEGVVMAHLCQPAPLPVNKNGGTIDAVAAGIEESDVNLLMKIMKLL